MMSLKLVILEWILASLPMILNEICENILFQDERGGKGQNQFDIIEPIIIKFDKLGHPSPKSAHCSK